MTLKFDGWPWKTIGHLFYATSSFVHHFVAIGEFKMELQSGNLTDDLEKHALWAKVNPIVHPMTYPTHIPFIPSESTLQILRYSDFKIWPWKSKVDVMGEVKICIHNVNPTIYRLTSLLFLVNQPSHSWDTIFISKFDFEIQGHGHVWGECWKSQPEFNILSTDIPFIPCQ